MTLDEPLVSLITKGSRRRMTTCEQNGKSAQSLRKVCAESAHAQLFRLQLRVCAAYQACARSEVAAPQGPTLAVGTARLRRGWVPRPSSVCVGASLRSCAPAMVRSVLHFQAKPNGEKLYMTDRHQRQLAGR